MTNDYRRVPGDYDIEHFQGRVDPELWGTPAADAAAENLYRVSTATRAPRGHGPIMLVGVFSDGTTVRLNDSGYFDCKWRNAHKGEPCMLVEVDSCRFHARHNLNCDECGGYLTVAENEILENERQVANA